MIFDDMQNQIEKTEQVAPHFVLCLIFPGFFWYQLVPARFALLYLVITYAAFILLSIVTRTTQQVRTEKYPSIVVAVALVWLICCYYTTPYKNVALTTIVPILIMLVSYYSYSKNRSDVICIFKLIYASCCIHAFFIIFQHLLPEMFNVLASALRLDYFVQEQAYFSQGLNIGVASAAIFSSIGLSIAFCQLLLKRKMLLNAILMLMLLWALILTTKRGMLLATVGATYFLLLVFKLDRKSKGFRLVLFSLVLILAFAVLAKFNPNMQTMIQRTQRAGKALSGREELWAVLLNCFKSAPVIGCGFGLCDVIWPAMGGGHNVYLQILAECGIIGLFIYLFCFVGMFIYNTFVVRHYFKCNGEGQNFDALLMLNSMFCQCFYLIYSFSGNVFYDYQYLALFIFFYSIPACINNNFLSNKKGTTQKHAL